MSQADRRENSRHVTSEDTNSCDKQCKALTKEGLKTFHFAKRLGFIIMIRCRYTLSHKVGIDRRVMHVRDDGIADCLSTIVMASSVGWSTSTSPDVTMYSWAVVSPPTRVSAAVGVAVVIVTDGRDDDGRTVAPSVVCCAVVAFVGAPP